MTRYDPSLRDGRGAYPRDSWTSIADVGKRYQGSKLTLEEYQLVEAAYVDAVAAFVREAEVERLELREVDKVWGGLEEGDCLTAAEVPAAVRAMLREELVCRLEAPGNDLAIHVGFDLYMFIGAARPCPAATVFARERGLFVEPDFPSPYLHLYGD